MPSMAIIPHWFQKHTAVALGIVLGSASFGGIVFPIMLNKLIPRIGFGALRYSHFCYHWF